MEVTYFSFLLIALHISGSLAANGKLDSSRTIV